MGLFGKKGESDDGDSNRLALFGNRSKSKSPAPQANPYAQPAVANNPYAQAKANAYAPAAPSNSGGYRDSRQGGNEGNRYGDSGYGNSGYGNNRYGDEKPMSSNRYGDEKSSGNDGYGNAGGDRFGANSGGYGANRYGAQGGYGGDRYGAPIHAAPRQGGYGGLGGDSYASQQEDDNRDALFGGAKSRVQQRQQSSDNPPSYDSVNQSGGYGSSSQGYGSSSQGYGGGGPTYQDRQLTAEEEEEEEINATKQQIRFTKQEDVASTRNALCIAQMAEETGRDTLARLGAQGEHIHNTEKNLDLAANQNRLAEEKARELKTLNKSMFAIHVSNPLTSSSRREARDQAIIDKHLEEREQREATRRAAYLSDQRMQKTFKDLEGPGSGSGGPRQKNLAERAKYQFEADSEDDEMEDEIDANLDALSGAAGRLNALARATGKEVDEQNKMLDRVSEKVCFIISIISRL